MLWLISNNRNEFNGLVDELTALGFKYTFFSKISDALNQLKKETPEGILIDADESEILCFEFCHQIKSLSHLKKTKLIVISSNDSESMEMSVFDTGADEFIIKPFRQKALVKRISARLNFSISEFSILVKIKGKHTLQIDKESFSVYLNQVLIPLPLKEFELLHLMASQPGKVFSRNEIFKKVWRRKQKANERTIDVHILRLRKKIGDEFFSTQKGVGYRFCA